MFIFNFGFKFVKLVWFMIFYVFKYYVLNIKRDKNNIGLKDILIKINVNNNIDLVK